MGEVCLSRPRGNENDIESRWGRCWKPSSRRWLNKVFCKLSCCRTAFSNDDWHPQATRDEQRFIAEVGGGAGFIDLLDAGGLTAVSTGKNVEANPVCLQHLAEHDDEGRFTGAAYRNVADADDWTLETMCANQSVFVERVARTGDSTVKDGERIHALRVISSAESAREFFWTSSKSASTVRSVAPR